ELKQDIALIIPLCSARIPALYVPAPGDTQAAFWTPNAAQEILKRSPEQAVPALIRALYDKDKDISASARLGLRSIEPPPVEQLLIAASRDDRIDPPIVALAELDSSALPEIVKVFRASDTEADGPFCRKLVWVMGRIGDPSALDALSEAFNDDDEAVASESLFAIARLGVPGIRRALLLWEQGGSGNTLRSLTIACLALQFAGIDREYFPSLFRGLAPEQDIKEAIAGARKDAAAFIPPDLRGGLVAFCKTCLTIRDVETRISALAILRYIGSTPDSQDVSSLLEDRDRRIREKAVEALCFLGNELMVANLAQMCADPDAQVRGKAVVGLRCFEASSVAGKILKVIDDSVGTIRAEAVRTAFLLKGDILPELFTTAVLRGKPDARKTALLLLAKCSDPSAFDKAFEAFAMEGDSANADLMFQYLARVSPPDAFDRFAALAQDTKRSFTRVFALTWLGSCKDKRVLAIMSQFAADPDGAVRRAAVAGLGICGRDAAPLIRKAIEDPDRTVRAAAVSAALAARPNDARQLLTFALSDPDGEVRINAARCLVELGDPASEELFRAALSDPGKTVRQYAAQGLEKVGGKDSVSRLVLALGDKSPDVVLAAAKALAKIGGSVAEAALLDSITREARCESLRIWAMHNRVEVSAANVDQYLIDALRGSRSSPIRAEALQTLAQLRKGKMTGEVLGLARELAVHPEPGLRRIAAEALAVGLTDGIADLRKMLLDVDPAVRDTALRLLRAHTGKNGGYDPREWEAENARPDAGH
ncbi:MAG: HEAT repeat domain-containing protein, partial [Candidatus Brocadiia bacterium]